MERSAYWHKMLNNFALKLFYNTRGADMGISMWNPGSYHMLYHFKSASSQWLPSSEKSHIVQDQATSLRQPPFSDHSG